MTQVLIDNDVILKICRWLLGSPARTVILRHGPPAILGSARFVLTRRLDRTRDLPHIEAAREELRLFLAATSVIEPDDTAILLAADFQEAAQELSVPLDGGESQLLAILLTTGSGILVTGDKRAISAAETVTARLGCCASAIGRVACLEQLLSSVVSEIGAEAVRARVCADSGADTTVATCFSCWSAIFREEEVAAGLASYITDVRSCAQNILVAGNNLAVTLT
jgi:hypothetical protein